MPGGLDGDGFEGFKFIHARFYGQPGAEGQELLGDYGRIRDDGYLAAGLCQIPRRRETLIF